jgi:hypothetical protein
VMDHVENDKKRWVDDFGCHDPPPKRPSTVRKPTPGGKPSHPEREKGS